MTWFLTFATSFHTIANFISHKCNVISHNWDLISHHYYFIWFDCDYKLHSFDFILCLWLYNSKLLFYCSTFWSYLHKSNVNSYFRTFWFNLTITFFEGLKTGLFCDSPCHFCTISPEQYNVLYISRRFHAYSQKHVTVVAGVVRALVITAHYLPSAAHISLFYCSAMPGIEMKATKNVLCHLR